LISAIRIVQATYDLYLLVII